MKIRLQLVSVACLLVLTTGAGCSRLRAKAAFKEGNKLYRDQNFKQAIQEYERAVELHPGMSEAYFYLGSSHQALYRPAKDTPANKEHLDKAIENYKKSVELNKGDSDNLKKVRANTLAALVGIYSDAPYKNFETSLSYAQQLVQDNPDDTRNLYAMANLYEKFEKTAEAEEAYNKIFTANPKDPKACAALAGFYNKPLWAGRSKFDDAVAVLEKCANLAPSDPTGFYRLAVFYWDKAFRDPLLTDVERIQYADTGLVHVDTALAKNKEYVEALVYKGLLLRVKANVARDPRERDRLKDEAERLSKDAEAIKKRLQAAASPSPGASPGS